MFLFRVVVGNGEKLIKSDSTRTGPSPNYHSVLGEVVGGGDLNFDEVVVYNDAATLPAYFIIYKY